MRTVEWKYLRGLHELYVGGKTRLKILNNSYIERIIFTQKKLIRYQKGNHLVLESSPRFKPFYENEFLQTFLYYNKFFEESGLENNSKKNFTEQDLKALIFVFYNKQEIKKRMTTRKKLSAELFRKENSKYIENRPSLEKAILQLLKVDAFPENDPKNHQWRWVVDCLEPQVIVLCENLDCLKVPVEYKKSKIELWYVGGNNTKPLQDISADKLGLPIYYFCDWDYNGLDIYCQVKNIFKEKGKDIILIEPPKNAKKLPVAVKHHKSKWSQEKQFSGLDQSHFTIGQIEVIDSLISKDEWIEEESIDLIEYLIFACRN
ncbi:hypothetical protein [uncultured Chryseobacterium sp.]|uniref:hypothetical protein n=1 Tax=uncultured Chryseobacterium sp. TaxID=259322 RepID=UPI0025D7AD0B|nr:hypothetical protein [uncultured Chryseobacterium sp.]